MLFIALFWSGAAASLLPQATSAAPQDLNMKISVPAYEIVSIKLASSDERGADWQPLPNGFDFKNLPLAPLIYQAYGITLDSQISGLPEWAKSDRYYVSARADEDTVEAWKKLSRQELLKQQQLMLQALFAVRCQLKMRHEIKQLPVYDLVIAKNGLKMKEAAPEEKESSVWKTSSMYSATGQRGGYTITATTHAGTALGLAHSIPSYVGRVIVVKTSLGDKRFDFELKWSSDDQAVPDAANAGSSIFKALEEQLGLKLEPTKEPIDTFVVEHVERPSAN